MGLQEPSPPGDLGPETDNQAKQRAIVLGDLSSQGQLSCTGRSHMVQGASSNYRFWGLKLLRDPRLGASGPTLGSLA